MQTDYFDTGTVTQNLTLHRKSCKKESYGAKKVQVLGPIFWNDLPGGLRDSESLQIFKKNLIALFLDNYNSDPWTAQVTISKMFLIIKFGLEKK